MTFLTLQWADGIQADCAACCWWQLIYQDACWQHEQRVMFDET
jgi:hypothetical protein